MNYNEYKTALSEPRIERYKTACNGDKNKALILYRYNIKLCQQFYGVLGVLEVVLRNAINKHYISVLSDSNWLITQSSNTGFLAPSQEDIFKERDRLIRKNSYSHDRLVASLGFGTWTIMFSKNFYKNAGKTLLQIFPYKTHGITQKQIYRDLDTIRNLRNRIAHYEPVCFLRNQIHIDHTKEVYDLIMQYLRFMGYAPDEILYGIENPTNILSKIKQLADSI